MLGDENQRSFQRIEIDCPASVKIGRDGFAEGAIVKNLSGGGFLLWIERPLDEGSQIEITVSPETPITPPLSARVEVLRCNAVPESEGSYAVACAIREVLPG